MAYEVPLIPPSAESEATSPPVTLLVPTILLLIIIGAFALPYTALERVQQLGMRQVPTTVVTR